MQGYTSTNYQGNTGYPPQQNPYATSQPNQGYPPQQPQNNYVQTLNPSANQGYPPQANTAYPPQNNYTAQPPSTNQGYPPQQPTNTGYPPQQPQQTNYPPQNSYTATSQPNTGYPPQQQPPSNTGYPPSNTGYPPQPQNAYSTTVQPNTGYPPQQPQQTNYPPQTNNPYSYAATTVQPSTGYPPSATTGYSQQQQPTPSTNPFATAQPNTGYPPQQPPSNTGYPPQQPQQPQQTNYPPQTNPYSATTVQPSTGYPPSATGYPPQPNAQSNYPPTATVQPNTGYPPQPQQPPTATGYPPQPQQPQQTNFSPQQQPTPTATGYPPQPQQPTPTATGYPPQPQQQPPTATGYPPQTQQPTPTATGYPPQPQQQPPTATGYPPQPQQTNFSPQQQPSYPQEPSPTATGYPPQPQQPTSTATGYPPQPQQQPPTATSYPPQPTAITNPFGTAQPTTGNPYAADPYSTVQPPNPGDQLAGGNPYATSVPTNKPPPRPQAVPRDREPPKVVAEPVAPTLTEEQKVAKLREEMKMKQEEQDRKKKEVIASKKDFFSRIIEKTQLIANNSNRVASIIGEAEYNDLCTDEIIQDFFKDVVSLLSSLATQLFSEIELNALEVDESTQKALLDKAVRIMDNADALSSDCNNFITKKLSNIKELENRAAGNITQINQLIKNFLNDIQKLRLQVQEMENDVSDENRGALMTEKEKEGLTIGEIGKQLYLSETDYLRNLSIAIEKWVAPLKVSVYDKKPLCTKQQVEKLTILEKIAAGSADLVKSLQQATRDNETSKYAEIFIEKMTMLNLYVQYATGFDDIVKVIQDLYGDGLNKDFIKWHIAQKSSMKPLDLTIAEMFLLPLARVGRYAAFLKSLERKTDKNDIEYPVIEKASQILQEMNTVVFKKKLEFESLIKIQDLLSKVKTTIPLDFITGKLIIYDGLIEFKREGIERRRGRLWIMSDLLLLTQEVIVSAFSKSLFGSGSKTQDHYFAVFNLKDISLSHFGMDTREAKKRSQQGLVNTLNFDDLVLKISQMPSNIPSSIKISNGENHFILSKVERDVMKTLKLDEYDDIFKQDFAHTRHFIFLAIGYTKTKAPSTSANVEFIKTIDSNNINILHVSSTPSRDSHHMTLQTNGKGYQQFELRVGNEKKTAYENIEFTLSKAHQNAMSDLYCVIPTSSARFNSEFSLLESSTSYSQIVNRLKIAIHFVPHNSNKPLSQYQPENIPSSEFWTFVNLMGRKIHTEGWVGYKGDVTAGEVYYEEFGSKEVVYHVAPMMNEQEHRRYIGNDLLQIVFLEQDRTEPFDTTACASLGTMPAAFAVVQPVGTKYRLTFFHSRTMKHTLPNSPAGELDAQTMKQILLTKMHNSMVMSRYCAPWNRLWFLPRQDAILQLVKKYPRSGQIKNPDQYAKKSLFSASKGETYPQAGDTNATPSFEITNDEEIWKFYCSPGSTSKWIQTLDYTMSSYRIILSINEQVVPSSTATTKPGALTSKSDVSALPEAKRMVIVNATYGKLGDMKKSIDVTKQIQGIVNQQGGNKLELKAGTKKTLFGGEGDKVGKSKLSLQLIYKGNGETHRHTFKDEDFVNLSVV